MRDLILDVINYCDSSGIKLWEKLSVHDQIVNRPLKPEKEEMDVKKITWIFTQKTIYERNS